MSRNENLFIRKIGKQYILISEANNSDINFIRIALPSDAQKYTEDMRGYVLTNDLDYAENINDFAYVLDEKCKNESLAFGTFKANDSDEYFTIEMYLLNLDMNDEHTRLHKNDNEDSINLRHAIVFLCYPEGEENTPNGWEMADIKYVATMNLLPIKMDPFGYFINNIPSDFGIDITNEK